MSSELRVDKINPVDGVSTDSGNNRYGGGIIQVVQSYGNGAETQTSSTSYVATGTAATITPKFSTSKIMVSIFLQILREVLTTPPHNFRPSQKRS